MFPRVSWQHKSLLDLQNELAVLEFIHCLVETLDRHFGNVCELDLMFNMETVRSTNLMSNYSVLQVIHAHSLDKVFATPGPLFEI